MMIQTIMQQKGMSQYRLSKTSGIPYTTVHDICSGRAQLEKCSAETVYKLAQALDISMETLLEPCFQQRSSFELFKSSICHRLKEMGDINFIIDLLENDEIRMYHQRKWYPESLYLLAMLDYISRINDVPLCEEYADLRRCRLKTMIYPAGVLAICAVTKSDLAKRQAEEEAIPEFMRFNIVESEVRNVI